MTEAGWFDGWLPRVLRPFAPVVARKRKTLCQQAADGVSELPSSQGGEFSSKRQRLLPSVSAKNKQVTETTNPVSHFLPQKLSQGIGLRKQQPPQQQRQAEKGHHGLQAPSLRGTQRTPLASILAQVGPLVSFLSFLLTNK